jgi:hypothetical protein
LLSGGHGRKSCGGAWARGLRRTVPGHVPAKAIPAPSKLAPSNTPDGVRFVIVILSRAAVRLLRVLVETR